jgi:DNA-directed RNA polymerase specialized sigma24 family protein
MLSASKERLKELWLKAAAASDPAEVEPLLWAFRDAVHEHIDQCKAEKHQEDSAVTPLNGSDSEIAAPQEPGSIRNVAR